MSSEDNRNKLFLVLGRFVILAFLLTAAILSGQFTDFMSAYGLFFVLLGGAALALMSFDVHEIASAFKDAARTLRPGAEIQKSIIFWESASRNFWMVGALATLVGFVVALTVSEGGIPSIATRMATSFVPAVYGAILSVVCLVAALKMSAQRSPGLGEETGAQSEKTRSPLGIANLFGYVLFLALIVGTLIRADMNATEPIFTPWGWVTYWPSLLVVLGGTTALVLYVGNGAEGHTFTFGFAVTGLIGSLMGFIQVLLGFSSSSIQVVTIAMTFVLSSCLFALLGMMLVGAPLEDRTVKGSPDARYSTLSRVAWYAFPLVTLIFIVITFVLVLTPMKVHQ
jgi:disulfide bond formation protein DsbB